MSFFILIIKYGAIYTSLDIVFDNQFKFNNIFRFLFFCKYILFSYLLDGLSLVASSLLLISFWIPWVTKYISWIDSLYW